MIIGFARAKLSYSEILPVRKLDPAMIQQSYLQVKQHGNDIIYTETERLLQDSALLHLVGRK